MKQIGDNIRKIRLLCGMSRKQLADGMSIITGQDITEQMLSSWENGQERIFADSLLAIADILDCSVLQLYGWVDPLEEVKQS